MKLSFKSWHVVAILAIGVSFSSCKKDDDETTPTTTTPATFTSGFDAKVDGVTFNESILYGLESSAAHSISITASSNGSFPAIGLVMPNDITPGTYTMSGFASNYRGVYNIANSTNGQYGTANGAGGTLVITSHNLSTNEIVGTFNFVAAPNPGNSNTNSFNITNGSFSVHYN